MTRTVGESLAVVGCRIIILISQPRLNLGHTLKKTNITLTANKPEHIFSSNNRGRVCMVRNKAEYRRNKQIYEILETQPNKSQSQS